MTTPTCFAVTEEITFFDNHENLIFDYVVNNQQASSL